MCITFKGDSISLKQLRYMTASSNGNNVTENKVKFADLDTFLKIAPIIGLAILAYLNSLYPNIIVQSNISPEITEMTVLQKAITSNTVDIKQINNRLRFLEVELAKHTAKEIAKKGGGSR